MKKKVILAFLSVVLVIALTATPVFAKKDKDEGKKGPFEELQDALENLTTEVFEAIEDLQEQIDGFSINWDDIEGMPEDFADGVDDVGIETESDPTVLASVKDGVSWTEIIAKPAGFADNVDDVGPGDGHSLDAADSAPVDAVYVDNDGEVGIGTTSPNHTLDVAGDINSTESFKLDGDTVLSNTGTWNILVGKDAGASITIGFDNSAMGYQALFTNTTGSGNSAVGSGALRSNTTGGWNSAMGEHALYDNTTGSYNAAMGSQTLRSNTTGKYNTAIGQNAGYNNTTGDKNVFLGYRAGYFETGSNKLYIANSMTGLPLIYGDFTTEKVSIKNLHLIPQSTAPSSPSKGDIYYDSTDDKLKCYDGSGWRNLW